MGRPAPHAGSAAHRSPASSRTSATRGTGTRVTSALLFQESRDDQAPTRSAPGRLTQSGCGSGCRSRWGPCRRTGLDRRRHARSRSGPVRLRDSRAGSPAHRCAASSRTSATRGSRTRSTSSSTSQVARGDRDVSPKKGRWDGDPNRHVRPARRWPAGRRVQAWWPWRKRARFVLRRSLAVAYAPGRSRRHGRSVEVCRGGS